MTHLKSVPVLATRTKPTVYTVTMFDDGEVTPYAKAYVLKAKAIQEIEQDALERYEYCVDVNDESVPPFPGVQWDDDMMQAYSKADGDDTIWIITAAEIE